MRFLFFYGILVHSLGSAFAIPRVGLLDVGESGSIYLVYRDDDGKQWGSIVAVSSNGQLDTSFGDQGIYRLVGNRFIASLDVWRGTIAITDSQALTFLDQFGHVKKEILWSGSYASYVKFNPDGSIVGAKEPSSFFKLTSSYEYDSTFGHGGELRIKGKELSLYQMIQRDDGSYLISGEEHGGTAFGCIGETGHKCDGQSNYYINGRYDQGDRRGFGLVTSSGAHLALGRSRDGTELFILQLNEDMKVIQEASFGLREEAAYQASEFSYGKPGVYVLLRYFLSEVYAVYKVGFDGRPDADFGRDGEADLNLPDYYFSGLGKMAMSEDGEVIVGAYCSSKTPPYPGGVCLVRLRADGFLDKTFGVDGVVTIEVD